MKLVKDTDGVSDLDSDAVSDCAASGDFDALGELVRNVSPGSLGLTDAAAVLLDEDGDTCNDGDAPEVADKGLLAVTAGDVLSVEDASVSAVEGDADTDCAAILVAVAVAVTVNESACDAKDEVADGDGSAEVVKEVVSVVADDRDGG